MCSRLQSVSLPPAKVQQAFASFAAACECAVGFSQFLCRLRKCSRLSRVFLQPVKSCPSRHPTKVCRAWNVHLATSVLRRLLEEVAHSVLLLGRRIRRRHPGWIGEVEELSHIHLCGIALGEARNLKASFD